MKMEKILHTDSVIQVLDHAYLSLYHCEMTENCTFTSPTEWRLKLHEKVCTNDTKMSYKQIIYGGQDDIRAALIAIGVIEPNDSHMSDFVTYDIGNA